jgi:drug/metabolite transporter (DMT)-like permease
LLGTLLVIAAASCFGTIPYFSRIAFADGVAPSTVVVMRYLVPCLIFAVFLPALLSDRKAAMNLLLAGFAMAAGTYGYAIGIRDMDVAIAAIIFFSFPLFVTLYKGLFYHQFPTRVEALSLVLVFVAVVLVAGPIETSKVPLSSVLLTFLGPAAYGIILVMVSTQDHDLQPMTVSAAITLGGLVGASLIFAAELLSQPSGMGLAMAASTQTEAASLVDGQTASLIRWLGLPHSYLGWIGAAGLAFVATLLPNLLLPMGATAAGSLRSAIAGTFELPVSLSFGWFVLQEPAQINQIAGSLIILLSLLINILKRSKPLTL